MLVLTFAGRAVPLVARIAGAEVGAQCVGAGGEHVAGTVLALVLVWKEKIMLQNLFHLKYFVSSNNFKNNILFI